MATAVQLREALRARGREVTLELFSGLEQLSRWAATGATRPSLLICAKTSRRLLASTTHLIHEAVRPVGV